MSKTGVPFLAVCLSVCTCKGFVEGADWAGQRISTTAIGAMAAENAAQTAKKEAAAAAG
eukprot:SAG22_NODE_2784_length_2212_cov_2.925225_1_plen_58_part_10